MPDEKIRTSLALPLTHYKRYALWAWLKSRPIATLASDVLQARAEDKGNQQWIEECINERAADLGLTPDQLKERIWAEMGITSGGEGTEEEGDDR